MSTMQQAAHADLKTYMERIERIEVERKELGDDVRSIYAEAKARGFDPKALRKLIVLRKKDATKRVEEETLLDTYMHAVGMANETPLFAQVGAMGTDTAAREQVVEAFKLLVPVHGEIIVKIGGAPLRLWRDDDGAAHVADYVEPTSTPAEKTGKALKKPATVLTMVPKAKGGPSEDEIKRIADDAQAASDRKKAPAEPENEPA